MSDTTLYNPVEPSRAEVDAWPGLTLLEFGVDWCPHCQIAQAAIGQALASGPDLRHLRVEDGRGRPLGRAFGIKLWPTLVLLRGGQEIARLVRPTAVAQVSQWLGQASL